jgi:hypothetical protein
VIDIDADDPDGFYVCGNCQRPRWLEVQLDKLNVMLGSYGLRVTWHPRNENGNGVAEHWELEEIL